VSRAGLPERRQFRRWVLHALRGRRAAGGLVIRIVDEDESAELNGRYRHKKGPTNVLSFRFDAPWGVPMRHLGDLVICAPLVQAEAIAQRKSEADHWAHLVIHGVLHLLGFDHQDEVGAAIMEGQERDILASLQIPDPYLERAG
jgi:probable rRNA maturation factor